MDADDLLGGLDPEQRQVATALHGPVRVLAGAGTGKTRAITHRIAYGVAAGVYKPTEVLAVTFTTRAAGEMRTRLRGLGAPGVQARTFHSAALRQVRYFWPKVYGGEPPTLIESKLPFVGRAAKDVGVPTQQATLRDLASEIEWSKVSNVRPDEYAALARRDHREVAGVDPQLVARVYAGYEGLKSNQGRMDMEDVLLLACAILSEDERVAATVRGQYRHLVVDEFQDVNPIQNTLLDLWLGGRQEICVVGDPAQTIYSFAGARASYLTSFTSKFPEAATVELVRNYRSTPQVITAANALLHGSATRSVHLRAVNDAGPDISWRAFSDELSEAAAVARRVQELRESGLPLREMAILFRINAQSENFEEALADAGVPYVVRGAARFFDRREVKQAISLLRGQVRAETPPTGDLAGEVRDVLAGMGWSQTAPATRGQSRDEWESLAALVSQASTFASDAVDPTQATLTAFVAELDRRAHEQHAPVAEGVTLATIHAAKGLEWSAVFLGGVHEGSLPLKFAETPAEMEEERRLLYVGITRACQHLWVSWSKARTPGQGARRSPSRFISPLLPQHLAREATAPAPAAGSRKRGRKAALCRTCNKPLSTPKQRNRGSCDDCPVPYDNELYEQLRIWRLERSKADEVPAYVVLTDATLEALAEVVPTTKSGLLSINGVGPVKVERYSDDLLQILAAHRAAK